MKELMSEVLKLVLVTLLVSDIFLQLNSFPAGIYLLKVNNKNTRIQYEICSKLTIKTPERPGVILLSLLLTLNTFYTLF